MRPSLIAASCALALTMTGSAAALANGDFEDGLNGWTASNPSVVTTTTDSVSGFAAEITNTAPVSEVSLSQIFGVGNVSPGETITISWSAKGALLDGGVAFARVRSFNSVGGETSFSFFGPFFPNDTSYTDYSFSPTLGADVSGGVQVEFAAVTGGAPTSSGVLKIDNVTTSVVPEPSAVLMLGSGLGLFALRRRRA